MIIPKEYDSLMCEVAENFRAGSFALFEWELESPLGYPVVIVVSVAIAELPAVFQEKKWM